MANSRPCTDGEWPCEMSTYVFHVEQENRYLKDFLVQLRLFALDPTSKNILSPSHSSVIAKKIADMLEEYPDFLRAREEYKKEREVLDQSVTD